MLHLCVEAHAYSTKEDDDIALRGEVARCSDKYMKVAMANATPVWD